MADRDVRMLGIVAVKLIDKRRQNINRRSRSMSPARYVMVNLKNRSASFKDD